MGPPTITAERAISGNSCPSAWNGEDHARRTPRLSFYFSEVAALATVVAGLVIVAFACSAGASTVRGHRNVRIRGQ